MAYNFASAFAPPPTLGTSLISEFAEQDPYSIHYKPKKIDIVSNPINIGKTNTQLLDLRTRWLNEFLAGVKGLNPEIPRDVAVEWVDHFMPLAAAELVASMMTGEPQKLAFRLADAWDAV